MKRITVYISALAILMISSCTLFNTPPALSAGGELGAIRAKYLTSFDILNGTFVQSGRALLPFNQAAQDPTARATVPVYSLPGPIYFPTLGVSAPQTISNYPEAGQTSVWTVETTGTDDVYLVKVTTSFPSYDPRDRQEEWYYVKDLDSIGIWTTADIITDADGNPDSKHRERNHLYFRDGSVQTETIVKIPEPSARYAAFDVGGSLEYPGAFLPNTDSSPNAVYSSAVVYHRDYSDAPDYSFWNGQRVKAIVGIRYYTEQLVPGSGAPTHLRGTTIAFEKAITSLYTGGGDFVNAYSSLFLAKVEAEPDQAFLALTVLRQETVYKLASYVSPSNFTVDYSQSSRDTRSKTRVLSVATANDSYITLVNDEAAAIASAGGTLWVPTANDPAIGGSYESVGTRQSSTVVTTSDGAPLVILTDTPIGELGTLYKSVVAGAAVGAGVIPPNATIPGDLTGPDQFLQFNGLQGIQPAEPNAYSFFDKGTVHAWVYVNTSTNYGGIVHAGIETDFSDELWTLQFVGNNNTPGFALVAQGPYVYDLVQSSERLVNGRWYHLVGSWDREADFLRIYVNGVQRGSARFRNVRSNFPASRFANPAPVVIGSQFYDSTKVLPGYYGINGRINGVIIENRAWSATEIRNFYEAHKDKTAFW